MNERQILTLEIIYLPNFAVGDGGGSDVFTILLKSHENLMRGYWAGDAEGCCDPALGGVGKCV